MRGVYAALEAEGLVQLRRGTFVAAGVRAAPELEEIAGEAIRAARAAGLDPRALAEVALAVAATPRARNSATRRPRRAGSTPPRPK